MRYPGETRNMVNHIFETLEILDKLQIIDILEDYDVPAVALRAQDFPVTEGSRADVPDYTRCNCWLHQSCQTNDNENDLKKVTQLLDIYALEIQMYTFLYIKSAILHPLIMGVIRKCGGKMHLREGEFEKAHTDFFEAFKNYDESGSSRRTTCLNYLVLRNICSQVLIKLISPYTKITTDLQALFDTTELELTGIDR
ncbi:conserved hypothetical protein [Culex quinquefasciatus]|uniref:Uncharacterized protein n=3 Tax=Culex pipiens complex TaxID=518105 RepID=B0XI38_CULQU|nr:conserved hypothetical protein [Culex quinquefasciatus]|eukprot:XP_001869310.1 conserved hypothetical protein [Culex quinquefasciatus]